MTDERQNADTPRFDARTLAGYYIREAEAQRKRTGTWADVIFGIPLFGCILYFSVAYIADAIATGRISAGKKGGIVLQSEQPFAFLQGMLGYSLLALGSFCFITMVCRIRWRKWHYRHLPEPEYSQIVFAPRRSRRERAEE